MGLPLVHAPGEACDTSHTKLISISSSKGGGRGGKPAGPWVRSVSLTCGKPRGRQDGGVKRKFTDIMCWRWCGREESPQAFGSAGGYPLTCHQATGMMGAWTRPRLLHERYKRIQMYGSISTGKLPSHQRDPVEGDCLTKPSASWACKGGGAPKPAA